MKTDANSFPLSNLEYMFTKVLVQNSSQYWASTFNWRGKGIANSYAQASLLLLFLYGISAKKAVQDLARSLLCSSIRIQRREKETQKLIRSCTTGKFQGKWITGDMIMKVSKDWSWAMGWDRVLQKIFETLSILS